MSAEEDLLLDLMFRVSALLGPVATASGSRERTLALIARTGWHVDRVTGYDLDALDGVFDDVRAAFDSSLSVFEEGSDAAALIGANVGSFALGFGALRGVDALAPVGGPTGLDALADDLLLVLVDSWLDLHPAVGGVLWGLGLYTPSEAIAFSAPLDHGGEVVREPWRRPEIRVDAIGELLSDPGGYLAGEYGIGASADAVTVADAVFPRAARLLSAIGAPSFYTLATHNLRVGLPGEHGGVEAHLDLALSRDTSSALVVTVTPSGAFDLTVGCDFMQVALQLSASATFSFTEHGLVGAGGDVGGAVAITLRNEGAEPAVLVGAPESTHLSLHSLTLSGSTALSNESTEHEIGLALDGLRIVVNISDFGDGFLDSAGDTAIEVESSFALRWSTSGGLRFEGSAALELVIAARLEIGPLRLENLRLAIEARPEGFEISGSIGIGLELGPVAARVDGLGVRAMMTDGQGSLGFSDAAVEVKPPNGFGLAVDAGPVSGGGYLAFYPEIGRYTGVAQLDVVGIAVRAIGIVDTVLPGGEEGFSFLLLITAEFSPIQLGMGFTLNGIGGLVGIHRTLMTEPLRNGVREGSLDNILFPEDPVRDANALIANLQSIFPPAKDQYVFGIMVKLGYGTPTLVTAEIGLILKVPDPIIVLLGSIAAKLPTAEAAVIDINLDVLGILDFGQKSFSLDASLRDSRIAIFAISGDMALRLSWGEPPSFALSIGGLHPAFQPPAGFPTLRRVTISVGDGDSPRLGFEAYLALTANSLQFGARIALYAEAEGFSIEGYLGFDALIIFEPFSFRFDFAAGLVIKAAGITLLSITVEGTLEGPTPWHVRGRASFSILFFEVSVDFDARFGEEQRDSLPEVTGATLLDEVRDALQEAGNWSSALPEGEPTFVSFAEAPVPADVVRIDPLGTLTVRQKVVPLNRTVSKVGESRIDAGPLTISITETQLGSVRETSPRVVKEYFAPALVEDLDDAAKLSRPSFERMDGGASFGADDITAGAGQSKPFEYETIRTDAAAAPPTLYTPSLEAVLGQVRRGSLPKSVAARSGVAKFAPAKGASALVSWGGDGAYVVVSGDTLVRRDDILAEPTTQGAAASSLAAHLVAHPEEHGSVQVVPLQEAA